MKEPHDLIRPATEIRSLAPVEVIAPRLSYDPEISIDEDLGLRNYWRAVRKHLLLILFVTACGTLIAAIYMAYKPDTYEAQARVQVDAERINPALNATKNDALVFNDPTYFSTQLQVLSSGGLLRRVVKELDLEHNRNFLRPKEVDPLQNLLRMAGLAAKDKGTQPSQVTSEAPVPNAAVTPAFREDLEEAARLAPHVEVLQGGLEVEPVKEARLKVTETRLIDVRFSHSDPQVAAKVANSIADVFVLMNLQRKTESNTTTGDFLQNRVAELQTQIRRDEERLINYGNNNQILSLDASQNTVVDRLVGLSKQLLEAENERKGAEAAFRASLTPGAAEALAEDGVKQASDLENKLGELRARRAQLLVENTEEWPEVKEVSQQIAALQRQVQDRRTRSVSTVKTNLETRYRQTLSREQALRSEFNRQRGETLTQNAAAINYRIIQQEIETGKTLLNGLLQRAKENEVALAGTLNNIYVIDRAIPPKKPIGPRRLMNVGLALIVFLMFGVGLALLLDRFDNTVRTTGDVEQVLRLPALAVIPSAGRVSHRRYLHLGDGTLKWSNGNGNGSNSSALLPTNGAQSPLAEAFRHLRTSIILSRAGRSVKTILVTSSQAGDGKTTTAVNLATSLAQTGSRVLVIDGDMRRPRLHTIFELENRYGLSTILSGGKDATEAYAGITCHQPTGVHVLTSGPPAPNAAELIGSDQMSLLLMAFQSTYTHIIIDSPPISSFTDGVLISSVVDGVVLVVHGGKSSRDLVRRSRQVLQDAGARILGVVLNNVTLPSQEYNYYYNS